MKAFVDCGAFRGSILRRFRQSRAFGTGFRIFAFECNPTLSKVTYETDVEIIRKAVWTKDGDLNFYLSKKNPDQVQGSSVFKEKITGDLDRDRPVKVECVDFSRWLSETFAAGDTVIIKMNIEGSEYPVLEKCLNDGSIKLISELHVQWHWQKIKMPRAEHDALVSRLKRSGITMYSGYGQLKAK